MACFLLFILFCSGLLAESVAGVAWSAPSSWKQQDKRIIDLVGREAGSGDPQARYAAAAVDGDIENAVCVVYLEPPPASPGNIPPTDAWVRNFTAATSLRWSSQFLSQDGQWAVPKLINRTINGMATTVIDTRGRYFAGWNLPDKPYKFERMLGAVIQTPREQIAIKFVGPVNTIAANEDEWEALLASFKAQR